MPGGVAVAGSEGGAVLERTTGMPMRWRLEDARFGGLDVVALLGERLLLADGQRRLAAVGLRDGEFVPDFARSSDGTSISGVHAVQALSSGLLVQQFNGLTLHDERGALRGEAFTATARRHDHVAEAADGVFSVESVQGEALRAAGSDMLLAVRRFDAEGGLRAVAPPIVLQVEGLRLSDACAIDGWLLLGGDDQTLAIAGQTGETKPR